MKTINKYIFLLTIIFAFVFGFSFSSHAMTPVLSLVINGDGDSAQLNVNGDPSVSVLMYYSKSGTGIQVVSLGNTSSTGYFSTSVSTSYYKIIPNSTVYVVTGGINGLRSNSITWPIISNTTTSTLSLSQASLMMTIGQTATVTALNNPSNSLYMSSSSNPQIANVSLSTNQITVNALTNGTTTATICSTGSSTNCVGLPIVVQAYGAQTLTFSQNNITISSGQGFPVTIFGGTGSYVVQSNSSPSIIQTSLSGNVITLSTSYVTGSSAITICSSNISSCGILTVNAGSSSSSSVITFSQQNPTIYTGQSMNLVVYGGTGSYYISSNSNSSVVQPTLTGSTLTLYSNTSGSSTLVICSYSGGCGTMYVTSISNSNNNQITLSQNNLNLGVGQTLSVTISGGTLPYNIPFSSNNIFQINLNGNVATVYGVAIGSSSLNICSANGACSVLNVTVGNNVNNSQFYLSQNNVVLTIGQTTTITAYGNGNYYVSNNSNPNVASIQINSNNISIYGTLTGSANVTICQSSNLCNNLYVAVNSTNQSSNLSILPTTQTISIGSVSTFSVTVYGFTSPAYTINDSFSNTSVLSSNLNSSGVFSWVPQQKDLGTHNLTIYATDSYGHSASGVAQIIVTQPTVVPAVVTGYVFTRYLGYGDKGEDVRELQKILVKQGFLSASPNGNYGSATMAAVKKFQTKYNISANGLVGPATKEALNKISSSFTDIDASKQQQIALIIEQIKQLQILLNTMRAAGMQ